MDKVSVLDDGVWELEKLKDQLLVLDQYKRELSESDALEQKMQQDLHDKEQEIANEIRNVIQIREQEIENSYEEQIDRQRAKIKRAKEDREKKKNKKIKERVELETASLREENKTLREEAKYIFKQNRVASIYNTRLYYAVFSPKGIGDIMIDLILLLFAFFILPNGIFLIANPEKSMIFKIVTYLIILLVVGGIVYIAYYGTKLKAPKAIEEGEELHYKIRKNNRAIKKIRRGIIKDKDESVYGLNSYDKEIEKLDKKAREIELEKGMAISTLKNTTSNVLANEIRNKHKDEVARLREEYEAHKEKAAHREEKVREIAFDLTNNYQAYLGAEFMNVETIDQLIAIMNERELRGISEAITIYRARQTMLEDNKGEKESVS